MTLCGGPTVDCVPKNSTSLSLSFAKKTIRISDSLDVLCVIRLKHCYSKLNSVQFIRSCIPSYSASRVCSLPYRRLLPCSIDSLLQVRRCLVSLASAASRPVHARRRLLPLFFRPRFSLGRISLGKTVGNIRSVFLFFSRRVVSFSMT